MKKFERDENGDGWYTEVVKRKRGFDWVTRVYLLDANGDRVQNLDEIEDNDPVDFLDLLVMSGMEEQVEDLRYLLDDKVAKEEK